MRKSQLLKVGDQGRFELKSPLSNLIHPQWVYTVASIRSISEMINDGTDPKELYQLYEIPQEQQERDFRDNICIIGLMSIFGKWIYIPETFIETMPDFSGVSYRPLTAVVFLGMVADELDLADYQEQLKKTTLEQLGIEAQIEFVAVGATHLISHEESTQLENTRKQLITSKDSLAVENLQQKREIEHLKKLNKALSDIILKQSNQDSP